MNNKPSTYLLTLFLFNIVCISAFAQGYKIDIQIDEFQQDKAYLAYYLGDSQFVKDTAVVEDGQFKFQGEEKLEKGIYLVVLPPDNQSFELIIDQDQQFSLTTSMDDLVENLEVTGSAENELFIREIHLKTPIIEKIRAIDEQIKTTEDETLVTQLEQKQKELRQSIVERENFIISEYPNERYSKLTSATRDPLIPEELEGEARFYYYFNHYFDSIDLSDSFFLRTPILYNKVRTYLETLTVQHQDSLSQSVDRVAQLTKANEEIYQWAMIYMVNKYAKSNIVGQDAVYCHIVEHYYAKGLCPWIGDERLQKMKNQVAKLKPTLLHSPAPQLSATDRKGKSQTLEQFEGNFVVLYFWKPDCVHCQTMAPKVAQLAKTFANQPVKIVTVNKGDGDLWKSQLTNYGFNEHGIFNWNAQQIPTNESPYNLTILPKIFVLDQELKILSKQISPEQVEMILNTELELEE